MIDWKRAKHTRHASLGLARVWTSRCGKFRVSHYSEGSGRYIGQAQDAIGWKVIGSRSTKEAAMKLLEKQSQ